MQDNAIPNDTEVWLDPFVIATAFNTGSGANASDNCYTSLVKFCGYVIGIRCSLVRDRSAKEKASNRVTRLLALNWPVRLSIPEILGG